MNIAIIGNRSCHVSVALQIIEEFHCSLAFCSSYVVVSGGATGVDSAAAVFAKNSGFKLVVFRPNYSKYFWKIAPLRRNDEIINMADMVFAIWDEIQKGGTFYTINKALALGKKVIIFSTKRNKFL